MADEDLFCVGEHCWDDAAAEDTYCLDCSLSREQAAGLADLRKRLELQVTVLQEIANMAVPHIDDLAVVNERIQRIWIVARNAALAGKDSGQ